MMGMNKALKKDPAVQRYLSARGRIGGKARARKYSTTQLSAWAKLGGRPPKNGEAHAEAGK
jgi:hypothetical protein